MTKNKNDLALQPESIDPQASASSAPPESETAQLLRLLQEQGQQIAELKAQVQSTPDGRGVRVQGEVDLSVLRVNHLKPFAPTIPGGLTRYANRDNLERWEMDGWQRCTSPDAHAYKDLVPIETSPDNPVVRQKQAMKAQQARIHEERVAAEARKGKVPHRHGVSTEVEYERSRGSSGSPSPTSPKG